MIDGYSSKRRIKIFLIVFIFIAVSGYIYFQSKNLITGPKLSEISPESGTTDDPIVTVSGKAKNIAFITLNGKQIFVDDGGVFSEKLAVNQGSTIITISVKDRFGKQIEKIIKIFRPRTEDFWPLEPENMPQNNDLENSENLLEQT